MEPSERPSAAFLEVARGHIAYRNDEASEDRVAWRLSSGDPIAPERNQMTVALGQAEAAAQHDRPVVILGPTGSGKQTLARIIEEARTRKTGSLESLPAAGCGVANLKRAVGRAKKRNGALLITDVDQGDDSLHKALLGVIEFRSVPRIYVTTTVDLRALVAQKGFNKVLLSRLEYDARIVLPPLTNHQWDIAPMVISRLQSKLQGCQVTHISYLAMWFLTEYPWLEGVCGLFRAVDLAVEAALAGTSKRKCITLKGITDRFRRNVLPGPVDPKAPSVEGWCGDGGKQRRELWATMESVEIGDFIWKHTGGTFKKSSPDHDRRDWAESERKFGGCPILFWKDTAGVERTVCELRFEPTSTARHWLDETIRPRRRGWNALVKGKYRNLWQVNVEDADEQVLFSVEKMRADLDPFLQRPAKSSPMESAEATIPASSRRFSERTLAMYFAVKFIREDLKRTVSVTGVCRMVAGKHKNDERPISATRLRQIYYEVGKCPPADLGEIPDRNEILLFYHHVINRPNRS